MGLVDFGAILVALIAALGAWAAQRAASKATRLNTEVSGRLEMERDAYERARAFDIQTIERQDNEILRLRDDNHKLRNELAKVKLRLVRIESVVPHWERLLNERLNEPDD